MAPQFKFIICLKLGIHNWRQIQIQVGRPREGQGDAAQRQGGAAGQAGGRREELSGMPDLLYGNGFLKLLLKKKSFYQVQQSGNPWTDCGQGGPAAAGGERDQVV